MSCKKIGVDGPGENIRWGGTEEDGAKVSPGIYFISIQGKSKSLPIKVIKL